jgi:hypothetical protein
LGHEPTAIGYALDHEQYEILRLFDKKGIIHDIERIKQGRNAQTIINQNIEDLNRAKRKAAGFLDCWMTGDYKKAYKMTIFAKTNKMPFDEFSKSFDRELLGGRTFKGYDILFATYGNDKQPAIPGESPSTRQTGRFISNLQYLAG